MLVGGFEAVGDFKTVGDFQRDGYFGFLFIFDINQYKSLGFIVVCAITSYKFIPLSYDFGNKQRVSSTLHDQIMLVGDFQAVGDFKTVRNFHSVGYFESFFPFGSH